MKYALKTADNSGLFIDLKTRLPVFLDDPSKPSEFWPVDATIPEGERQTGWILSGGKCVPQTEKIPPLTPDQIAAIAEEEKRQQDAQTDKVDLEELEKFIAIFEEKSASPELQAEAIRLLLRDLLRRSKRGLF